MIELGKRPIEKPQSARKRVGKHLRKADDLDREARRGGIETQTKIVFPEPRANGLWCQGTNLSTGRIKNYLGREVQGLGQPIADDRDLQRRLGRIAHDRLTFENSAPAIEPCAASSDEHDQVELQLLW